MKRFLGFPELLLLLILPFTDGRHFILSGALLVSLGFHIALRYKYPTHYPAFGSWAHVVLSGLCWVGFMLVLPAANRLPETGLPDPPTLVMGMMWYSAAGMLWLLFMGVQGLFWVGAVHSLWERGKVGVARSERRLGGGRG